MPNVQNLNIDLLRAFRRTRVDRVYECPSRDADGIICYIKGSQHFEFESGEKIEAHAGETLYLPYRSRYRNCVPDPDTEYLQVDFIVKRDGSGAPLFDKPYLVGAGESAVCMNLAYSITESVGDISSSPYGSFANLCGLIDNVYLKAANENIRTSERIARERVKRSVEYIETRYYENTSIEEIAAMSSTCVANLERLFRQFCKMTPGAYRNTVRVNKAKTLLLSGLTVEETALSVGFYDASHFSKMFKKVVGVAPSEYARAGHVN